MKKLAHWPTTSMARSLGVPSEKPAFVALTVPTRRMLRISDSGYDITSSIKSISTELNADIGTIIVLIAIILMLSSSRMLGGAVGAVDAERNKIILTS
jgi:hypothetical protein